MYSANNNNIIIYYIIRIPISHARDENTFSCVYTDYAPTRYDRYNDMTSEYRSSIEHYNMTVEYLLFLFENTYKYLIILLIILDPEHSEECIGFVLL